MQTKEQEDKFTKHIHHFYRAFQKLTQMVDVSYAVYRQAVIWIIHGSITPAQRIID